MRKLFKRLLITLFVLLALLTGIAFLLPDTYRIERTELINAPADKIFNIVSDLKTWPQWDAWLKDDPTVQLSYPGKSKGNNAIQQWIGEKRGSGKTVITASTAGELIRYEWHMTDYDITANGKFTFVEAGGAAKINWIMDGKLGMNPFNRYLGLYLKLKIGHSFNKGLKNLQELCEK